MQDFKLKKNYFELNFKPSCCLYALSDTVDRRMPFWNVLIGQAWVFRNSPFGRLAENWNSSRLYSTVSQNGLKFFLAGFENSAFIFILAFFRILLKRNSFYQCVTFFLQVLVTQFGHFHKPFLASVLRVTCFPILINFLIWEIYFTVYFLILTSWHTSGIS